MDYKNKYNDALERARKEYKTHESFNGFREMLLYIFPELKDSDDNEIRESIIGFLITISSLKDGMTLSNEDFDSKVILEWVDWLKKQKPLENYDEAEKEKIDFVGDGFVECHADFLDFKEGNTYWLEYIGDDKYNVRSDNLLGKTYHITPCQLYTVFKKLTWVEKQSEQKPDNVEPKFKIGDWVSVGRDVILIGNIRNDLYEAIFTNGEHRIFTTNVLDKNAHLWTIKDAKPGDIIYAESKFNTFDFIEIFYTLGNGNCWGYCGVRIDSDIYSDDLEYWEFDSDKGFVELDGYKFHPATKEQRNILERVMTNAGYRWNSEKKELRRI